MVSRERPGNSVYSVNSVAKTVLSPELVVFLVSSQFSEFLVNRRHVRSEEPPRPVGPRPGSEVKRRRVRPSVAVLQQFSSTRVSPFNKCYVGNVIHRHLHCVISSPVHPNAIRSKSRTRPLIVLIAAHTGIGDAKKAYTQSYSTGGQHVYDIAA